MNHYFIKKTLIFLTLIYSFSFSNWLVKIDEEIISTSEFQQYIDFQRESSGNSEIFNKTIKNEEALKGILQEYIEQAIINREAKKKNYTFNNKELKDLYELTKDDFIKRSYMQDHIDVNSLKVSENEAINYFNLYKKSDPNVPKDFTWDKLNPQEKRTIYQRLQFEKLEKQKRVLMSDLTKLYEVKKNKFTDVYIAVVNGEKVTKTEFEKSFKELSGQLGISQEQLSKAPEKERELMKENVLDSMIFEKLVKEEIKKKNYKNKGKIKKALPLLKKRLISQVFLEKEIFDKIPVSSKEVESEYDRNKKQWEQRSKQYDWGKVKKMIENSIKQKKANIYVKNFIDEKKESSLIKRNYQELKKIK